MYYLVCLYLVNYLKHDIQFLLKWFKRSFWLVLLLLKQILKAPIDPIPTFCRQGL